MLRRNDLNILGKRTLKYNIDHCKRPPHLIPPPTHSCGLQSHEFPDDAHTLLLPNHQLKRQRNLTRRAATTVPGTRRASAPQATFFSAPAASPLCPPPPPDFHVRQVRPATVYAEPHALSILIDRHQNDQQLRAEFMRKRKNAGHLQQAFEIAGFDATVTEIPCGHSEANGSQKETHNPMVAVDRSFCTSCTPGSCLHHVASSQTVLTTYMWQGLVQVTTGWMSNGTCVLRHQSQHRLEILLKKR